MKPSFTTPPELPAVELPLPPELPPPELPQAAKSAVTASSATHGSRRRQLGRDRLAELVMLCLHSRHWGRPRPRRR